MWEVIAERFAKVRIFFIHRKVPPDTTHLHDGLHHLMTRSVSCIMYHQFLESTLVEKIVDFLNRGVLDVCRINPVGVHLYAIRSKLISEVRRRVLSSSEFGLGTE